MQLDLPNFYCVSMPTFSPLPFFPWPQPLSYHSPKIYFPLPFLSPARSTLPSYLSSTLNFPFLPSNAPPKISLRGFRVL